MTATNRNMATVILKSVLRFLWDYGKELTILIFAVATYQSCNNAAHWKKQKMEFENKASRLETNIRAQEQVIRKNQRIFFENNKELKDVIDSLEIQTRKINYVHLIMYRDTGSRVIRTVRDTVYRDSVYYPVVRGEYKKKCHNASFVYFSEGDSLGYNYEIVTDISVVGHWNRAKEFRIFGLRLFDYGMKDHFVTVHNNCDHTDLLKNEVVEFKRQR